MAELPLTTPPTAARSAIMKKVRQRDTKPEMVVRRAAHALGYRFRVQRRDLPGSPDLVFPGRRKAILVHGCFWHRHPGCRLASTPKNNSEFWTDKFARNVERDARKEREFAPARLGVARRVGMRDRATPKDCGRRWRRFLGPAGEARTSTALRDDEGEGRLRQWEQDRVEEGLRQSSGPCARPRYAV